MGKVLEFKSSPPGGADEGKAPRKSHAKAQSQAPATRASGRKLQQPEEGATYVEGEAPMIPKRMPRISKKTQQAEREPTEESTPQEEDAYYREQVQRIQEAGSIDITQAVDYRVALGCDVSMAGTGLAWLESPTGDGSSLRIDNPARNPRDSTHRAVGTILKGAVVPLGVRLERLHSRTVIHLGDEWKPLPCLAVMERAFVNPKMAATAITLGQAQSAVLLALTHLYIPSVLVPPKTVKKFACGNGNATKDDVLRAAVEQFHFTATEGMIEKPDGMSQAEWSKFYDRADAWILAVIGGYLLGEAFEIPDLLLYDEQEEALEALPDLSELYITDDEEEPF